MFSPDLLGRVLLGGQGHADSVCNVVFMGMGHWAKAPGGRGVWAWWCFRLVFFIESFEVNQFSRCFGYVQVILFFQQTVPKRASIHQKKTSTKRNKSTSKNRRLLQKSLKNRRFTRKR